MLYFHWTHSRVNEVIGTVKNHRYISTGRTSFWNPFFFNFEVPFKKMIKPGVVCSVIVTDRYLLLI